jgi:cell division protein FtsQ
LSVFLRGFMARKNASSIADDELDVAAQAPSSGGRFEDGPLDGRLFDLDDEAESPFLRGQKRVPVKRTALPRKALDRVKVLLIVLLAGGAVALVAITFYRYATQSWRFQIDSSENIQMLGAHNVSRAQVLDVFSSDLDRNIFFVPLAERKKQLQEIPWIESATVMRLFPNRLNVAVTERTPVAFVEINSHIALIDARGVVMEMPAGQSAGAGTYSFPVIVGTTEAEPLSTRAARMAIYERLIRELDSGGTQYSRDLSDIDLSDPDDVKATVPDPQGAVLVHLGSSNFLQRFRVYVSHVQEWRTQFHPLKSVDLRYQHQVIVNPDEVSEPARPATGNPQDVVEAPVAKSSKPATHRKTKSRN